MVWWWGIFGDFSSKFCVAGEQRLPRRSAGSCWTSDEERKMDRSGEDEEDCETEYLPLG